jgi:ADP-heptose:LPS heptosyltransferase
MVAHMPTTAAPQKAAHKSLLLIYPDFLGDFLLFSPFLIAYKAAFEAQFDRVDWLCHPAVLPLAQSIQHLLPANMVVTPVDFALTGLTVKKLLAAPLTQKRAGQFMATHGLLSSYTQLWCPSFMPWLGNGLLTLVKSPRRIGRPVQGKVDHLMQKLLYTELVKIPDFNQFVYYQHHRFFTLAFGHDLHSFDLPLPDLHLYGQSALPAIPSELKQNPYVVLVPDSAAASKEWPALAFADIANMVLDQTPYDVVILGVRASVVQTLQQALPDNPRCHNLMQQTTVMESLAIINQAQALLCNDSFALHAGRMTACPTICLTNGGYLGRYWPYPVALKPEDWPEYYIDAPQQNLALIPPAQVWQVLHKVLLMAAGGQSPENSNYSTVASIHRTYAEVTKIG